ncbi:MAG TPA: hypothetical protein VD767_09390 [Thermomicrobiales bacterium]|nr:hypothetical protein [Thermomicrobiales bacterium]
MPDFPDLSWDRVPNGPFDDRLWWVLISLCVALLLTVQGIETALEGAWPHQRRSSRLMPRERTVQVSWGAVALLVVPGALLLIGIVAIVLWQDPELPDYATTGVILTLIGWGLFLLFSLNTRWFGRLFSNLGLIGPIALAVLLLTGDALLLSTFLDIVPDWDTLIDSIERGLRDFLPFVDEEG